MIPNTDTNKNNTNIRDDDFPIKTGANITFHLLKWTKGMTTFSLKAGGNINYHTLSGATELHYHEFPEIFLILSGKIRHLVNGEIQEMASGMLAFVRPTDVHRFEQLGDEPCEMVNFSFSLEAMRDLSIYLENDFFMWRFTEPVTPPIFSISLFEAEKLASELLKINSLQLQSVETARIKVKSILADLFTRFFLEQQQFFNENSVPTWLEELISLMRQPKNFSRGLCRMQDLACCTPEHLCKCFRKYLKTTPTTFINELKINHAARMLTESNEEIYAIATDLNFKSLSRFYHLFKKYYGISPAKYRTIAKRTDIPI